MKPEAQPHPCQDAQQSKDAGADQYRKEIMADSATPRDGCTGMLPDAGKASVRNDKRERPGRDWQR